MRKEQITVTNNSVCNSAENKGLEGKGMKRRLLHFKKRMVPAVSGALMGVKRHCRKHRSDLMPDVSR